MVAVSAPWLDGDGTLAGLGAAAVVGLGFGVALEQAGLGSARKLSGQFSWRRAVAGPPGAPGGLRRQVDLTVFKVMFTAVVVAMLGVFWLGRAGALDVSRLARPETWLVPQLVGGLLLGAGLGVAGLCPGTACVAAATGRVDGVAAMLGLLLGVLAAGLGLESMDGLYRATPRGPLSLPEWLGLPEGVVVLAVVLLALGAFRLAERLERGG